MNPFGTRARSDELAALLDGAVISGAYDAPALALVDRLRAVGTAFSEAAGPRPEFRTALRTRLLAVAAVQGIGVAVADVPSVRAAAPAAVTWRQLGQRGQRGLGVAAGAMASVVAVTGVAVASQRSLPGDPFYGTKRTTEALQLRFADGKVEKGTQHLEFAETRLREVRALALGRDQLQASGSLTPVASTASLAALGDSVTDRLRSALADMDRDTSTGTELLEEAFRASGEVEPLRVLATFARRQAGTLERVLPSLPTDVRDRAQQSLSLVTAVAQQTELTIELGTCGDSCNPQGSGPVLPTASPEPVPGTTAVPGTAPVQPTDEPSCDCAPSPAPAPTATSGTEPTPPSEPTSAPSGSPSPSPSPSSITPTTVPVPSGVPLPSGVPTTIPPVVVPTITPPALPVAAPAPA